MNRVSLRTRLREGAALALALTAWLVCCLTPAFAEPVAPSEQSPAEAAEPAPEDAASRSSPSEGVEEIIVTGTRLEDTSEDEPVSATGFSADEIRVMQFSDISDLAEFTPSLEIKKVFAASNPILFIRGVGLRDFNANSASAVAVVYDEIYMNSPSGQLAQFFDLAGVEVLRGPQGSLYGRNASAGAIVIRSRKPTGDFNSQGSVTYGRFNQVDVQAAIGGPLLEERLSARVAGRMQRRDPYIDNRCGGLTDADRPDAAACGGQRSRVHPVPRGLPEEVGKVRNWAGRGLLRLTPSEDLDFLLNVHGGQNRGDATQFQTIGTSLSGRDIGGYRDQDLPPRVPGSGLDKPTDGDPYAGDYNRVGSEDLDLFGTHLTGAWTLGDAVLTSISGYESNERLVTGNEDASPNITLEADLSNEAWQFSQEFRADGQAGEGLSWKLGGFFLVEDLTIDNFARARPSIAITQAIEQDTLTWAVYGHGTYELRPDLILEAGLRYNWEHKDFKLLTQNVGLRNGVPVTVVEAKNDEASSTVDAPTGDVSLTWRPLEDVALYGKYSRGFKGGHFNAGVVLREQIVTPVDPEFVDAFEVGLKSTWFDRRLIFNVAGFLQDYQDLQVFRIRDIDGFAIVRELINADDARIYGVEVDLQARPIEGLRLMTNGAWIESEYLDFQTEFINNIFLGQDFVSILVSQDFSGNQLINAPRWKWSGFVEYDLPLHVGREWGSLIPRFEWSYRSQIFFTAGNFEEISDSPLWKFHARLAYVTPGEQFELAFWARNLTDTIERVDALDVRISFNKINYVIGEPRTFGLTVSARF